MSEKKSFVKLIVLIFSKLGDVIKKIPLPGRIFLYELFNFLRKKELNKDADELKKDQDERLNRRDFDSVRNKLFSGKGSRKDN
jgi:hypothetical protein